MKSPIEDSQPRLISVAIDMPKRMLFTYRLPRDCVQPLRGQRIVVPFGKRQVIGFAVGPADHSTCNTKKLRDITEVLQDPLVLFAPAYLDWLEFAANYYMCPLGQVMAHALPDGFTNPKKPWPKETKTKRSVRIKSNRAESQTSLVLHDEQKQIIETIQNQHGHFYPALLHGVTGSGKTEVYIELIRNTLQRGQSAIYLVPEIGLTPQTLDRLAKHFSDQLLIIHSGLTPVQKRHNWMACLQETPKIMVGTRSALFAPFSNLGLIVVDEEHDGSYKQEDGFKYHARDLAVKRAQLYECPVILGSATPSLESWSNSKQKKFHYFHLPVRATGAALPNIAIIDIMRERSQTGSVRQLSFLLHEKIEAALKEGRQAMIYVGQRGYAKCAYCISCAEPVMCPNCSIALKYHKTDKSLKCHYCSFVQIFSSTCPKCKQPDLSLVGTGTQGIEEELITYYGAKNICRMDTDAMFSAKKMENALDDFFSGKTKIIVGTQIITKGHDFSNVGIVGITGIDGPMGLADFRSTEKTFQAIIQVAGRSGRKGKQGEVLVQSLLPKHPALLAAIKQDYKEFAETELVLREELNYPPFSRLVQIRFQSVNKERLTQASHDLKKMLKTYSAQSKPGDVTILGPAEMPLAKIRGKHRMHVLFKIRRGIRFQPYIEALLHEIDRILPPQIQVQIDVDPMSLL